MNQIELFNAQQKPSINAEKSNDLPKSPSKIESNRPANLTVSKIFSDNQKWRQCKIIGKNISIRSYSASCAFQGKLYVYGGYQILNGSLSDFYSIDLNDNQPKFNWVQIHGKNGVNPGARSKHALIGGKQKIYLIGGLHQDVHSSNDFYEFDPKTQTWTKLNPQGLEKVPRIDSFGCASLQKEGQQTIYIVAGYNEEKAEMSNAIYEFVPSKNKITVVFENNPKKQKIMPPLSGVSCTTDGTNLYIFGGKNEETRFNDLWLFNLKSLEYELLPADGQVPAVRSGHTINYHNDKLFVFGGIYDITWQLDDLHIYNLVKKSWTTLEQDSPRKIERKGSPEENKGDKSAQKRQKKKKSWYQTVGAGLGGNNKSSSSPLNNNSSKQKGFSTVYHNEETGSPGKMIDEQRKKVFYQKKAEMLKNFEVEDKEKDRYILLQTTSQAMKNSLDVIGNPSGKPNPDKLTEFGKQTHSKFLAPLENNSNLVIGKKPCARDGHCSVMLNDELIIFGGDRHQMSFNDIHKLNFNLAQKEIEKSHR